MYILFVYNIYIYGIYIYGIYILYGIILENGNPHRSRRSRLVAHLSIKPQGLNLRSSGRAA